MRVLSLVTMSVFLLAEAAGAAVIQFETPLAPEVGGSSGSGSASVTLNTTDQALFLTTNWSGLTGNTTVAHIHCCVAPPGTAPVAVTPGTLPSFPMGVTSGSYAVLLDLTMPSTYTMDFLAAAGGSPAAASQALLAGMLSGMAYLNIHTSFAPAGEIRGFLLAVPEPGTFALCGLALLTTASLRRRR